MSVSLSLQQFLGFEHVFVLSVVNCDGSYCLFSHGKLDISILFVGDSFLIRETTNPFESNEGILLCCVYSILSF